MGGDLDIGEHSPLQFGPKTDMANVMERIIMQNIYQRFVH